MEVRRPGCAGVVRNVLMYVRKVCMMSGYDEVHSEPRRRPASRIQDLLRDKRHRHVGSHAELDSRISGPELHPRSSEGEEEATETTVNKSGSPRCLHHRSEPKPSTLYRRANGHL